MSRNRALLLLLVAPLLTGMRDPFAPVADPCQTAQLSLWHYRGGTQSAERLVGILQNSEGKWRRIESGDTFNAGWQVIGMTLDSLTIDTGEGCEPRRWQWIREGTPNDKKDISAHAAGSAADEPREKRHPGGG